MGPRLANMSRYWIYMTSVGVTPPGASSSTPVTATGYNQAIFPDSGTTISQLPTALVNALLPYFPGAVSQGGGAYTVPCSYRDQAGTIDFGFGNTTIHVSYHEWFWFDGQDCYFGAQATQSTFLLGGMSAPALRTRWKLIKDSKYRFLYAISI